MSVSYYYSLTGSFPYQIIASTKFHNQVETTLTGSDFLYVNVFGDDVDVYFSSSLNSSSLSILDNIVANHDGIPYSDYGYNYEDFLTLSGSRSMEGSLNMGEFSIVSASAVNDVVVEDHHARHERSGVDSIDGDRLGIDYVPTYYSRNFGIPEAGNVQDLSAHLAGIDYALSASITNIFGANSFYTEKNNPVTTTGMVFQKAATLNFSCAQSGYYRVGWMYVWSYSSVAHDIQIRVRLDNSSDLLLPYHNEEPSDAGGSGVGGTDQRHENSGFKYTYITSGSHTVDLEMRSTKCGVDATIHHSSLEVWRTN